MKGVNKELVFQVYFWSTCCLEALVCDMKLKEGNIPSIEASGDMCAYVKVETRCIIDHP